MNRPSDQPAMLTAERLRKALRYDPETGAFTWRAGHGSLHSTTRPGATAGYVDKGLGYVRIRLDKQLHYAHRLAALYMTGSWPPAQIDHADGNRANNRWVNLRCATSAENMQNKVQPPGRSGQRGAFKGAKGRWYSRIYVEGRAHYLGRFDTADEAHAAYIAAKASKHEFQPTIRGA